MIKNQAGQTIELYAYDYSTGAPKTGDAANLTFYVAKDGGSVTALADTSAAELSSTNAPGWYRCDLSASETNFDNALFSGKSSTSNVVVVGRPASTTATYLAEMIARFLSMVEAAAGSPSEFRFTADALARTQTVIGMAGGNLDAQLAALQSDTNDIQARLPAALVGGRIDASVGAMAANVMTAAAAAADLTTELQSGLATSAALATVAGYVDTEVAAIKDTTDKLSTMFEPATGSPGEYRYSADALRKAPTGSGGGGGGGPSAAEIALAVWDESLPGSYGDGKAGKLLGNIPTATENADELLARDLGSGTGAGTSEERTVRSALRFLRNKWAIVAGVLTVRKEDDTTAAWTAAVSSTPGADPVTGNDPT